MRRLATPSALVALALAAASPALAAPGLVVAIDHSQRLHVSRPAGSVIVGNPAVADVTVVDAHTVFVSGRGYGVSEIVVLDPLGRTIWQGDVVVTAPSAGQVSVYRGTQVTEMACATLCSPSVRPGGKSGGAAGGAPGATAAAAPAAGGAPSPALPAPAGGPQASPGVP
jgi:hypothetical protein